MSKLGAIVVRMEKHFTVLGEPQGVQGAMVSRDTARDWIAELQAIDEAKPSGVVAEVALKLERMCQALYRDFTAGHLASNQPGKNVEHYGKELYRLAARLKESGEGCASSRADDKGDKCGEREAIYEELREMSERIRALEEKK